MLEMFSSTAFFRMITRKQFLGLAVENARTSLFRSAFIRQIQTIAPSIKPEQVKSARAGIRAQMVDKSGNMVMDLLIQKERTGLHVLNAVSPGMTCALAFASHLADELETMGSTSA